ncbi:MAG: glycosyltransferase [Ilumatobacteraceae bacterium]
MTRRVLFHCQHSLGLGHLVRSLALAGCLAEHFDVTLLNGGRLPAGTIVPPGVELVDLPSLGHDAGHRLVSQEPGRSVDDVCAARRALVLDAFEQIRPDVVVVELYPFGRRKFEFELLPLLEAATARADRPLVVSSVRDILVGRDDGGRHDERARQRADRYLDAVLVHSDPRFARFEESFRPSTPLAVPVHHTGFVVPSRSPSGTTPTAPRGWMLPRVLVSVGGGMVGDDLLSTAAAAAPVVRARTGLTTTLVAGPFLPDLARRRLHELVVTEPALTVLDRVDDLCAEIGRSAASVSQAGYNTTMDVLRAGRPAIVVPYAAAGEDEQTRRAGRLQELGIVRVIAERELTPQRFAEEVTGLPRSVPQAARLDLGGGPRSAGLVARLVDDRRSVPA